ncbi:uncharacterized protein Tco025E_05026 [Trypanosoma conorhini]|uniref:Uncharacterized protein n=1 Tax=Trypanosoma conorhini TaxID=83891 RepID=A0A422PGK5_9TRYP|nr:uncharacterized protein Tco025E_05026 [Trypanosoma conorhini]RNF16829.1 hypothetical protein Tco025E_05026 [Trypanosoma conorhini]
MPASSLPLGAKRPRDEKGENGKMRTPEASVSSSHAAIIEITHGMTQSAAAEYDKESVGTAMRYQDMDALLSAPAFREKTCRFLLPRADGTHPYGPVEMGVIQLVANDGKTLIFTSDAIAPVNVSMAEGKRLCIGDVVLLQRRISEEQGTQGEAFMPAKVEFVALDPSALMDGADWCQAASWNTVAMARWMHQLLSFPPGLAQLTCIMDSSWGEVAASVTAADAWLRSLQLPVLLQQWKNVDGGVEARKVFQMKKLVFSMLRLYVAILGSAEAIMTLPSVVEGVVYQFLGSPLFVDGLSVVLPQLAGDVSESTWASAQQTMLDAMKLAQRYVCREPVEEEGKGQRVAREAAERGFLTALHGISALWLTHAPRPSQAGMQAFMKLVEEMARVGVFRQFAQWMRQKERARETVSLVDKVHRPPSLQDVKDLHGLKKTSLTEMLAAMTQTYTPYLRQETLRFVECAMLATYAELYGPVASALSSYMESIATMKAEDADPAKPTKALQVTQVSQSALRLQLYEYSLEEVRLHALFGMPLTLTLRVTSDTRDRSRHVIEATSTFGCIVVVLSGKPFIFPVMLCGVVDNTERESVITATAYVLRDRDILPSLMAASAAASSESQGLPDAWFFSDARWEEETDCDDDADGDIPTSGHLGSQPPRFMPPGTSAVSYVLYLIHLQKLRAQMRQQEQSSVAAMGRAKGGPGQGETAPKGVLWWGSGGSSSGVTGDAFTHSTPLEGENEVLQHCLSELTDTTSLTASQVECLHTLTTTGPGVRALVGAVGCGKTTLMYASSLSRGRMQEALRKQHQPLWHATIKHSAQNLSARLGELAAAEEMEDLYKVSDGSSARDLPEEVTNAALGHIQEHVQLNEKLRQCHTPMLLRPKALKQTIPTHSVHVLQEENAARHFCPIETVMEQSHQRSLKAPLATVLNARLQTLKRVGDRLDSMARSLGENAVTVGRERKLFTELLPWIMSKKERLDTFNEAVRKGKSWVTYLSEDLWDPSTLVESTDFESASGKTVWESLGPAPSSFHAVTLPNAARSLCAYTRDEAGGWLAVFWEKQIDLLCFLQNEVMDEARHLFLLFLDLIQAVAATSQTSKATVVTATGGTLFRELAFLRVWQPHYLVVDDYEQICDALYLTLSQVNSAILAHQSESPLQHEQQLSLAIFRALQRELQGTPLLSSVALSESLRFRSPELHKAAQLCRNSAVAFYAPLPLGVAGNNEDNNAAVVGGSGDGQAARQSGTLTGFSSPCCVEFWTHAVALSASVTCDGAAAAFVCNRLRRIEPSMAVTVYCGFVKDKAVILEGMASGSDAAAAENMGSVCAIPFCSDAFVERDEECDVAVMCLSGIARRLRRFLRLGRQSAWDRLGAERSFVEQLEWWLWRTVSYARRGAVLVGSREVFSFLEPLRRLERFVLQVREQRGFWLPPEAKGAVLALRCPDHENCRQLALLTFSDYSGCQVRVVGEQKCRSLCLAPYENCTNPSHACLRVCHVYSGESDGCAAEDGDPSHSDCPFPCMKVQPCGHVCVRRCGEPCSPCEFVGLRELSCGQRVVSGMVDTDPVQTIVHHFQRVRCGEAPRPCEEHVMLRCPRCGGKNPMLCHEVVARGGMEHAVLSEMECAGCVALYNRVAKEHGVAQLAPAVPPTAGCLPLNSLPGAAQTRLQELQTFAVKKAQVMLQKEALETMQGRQSSEFHLQQEIYNRMQRQQEEEVRAHRQRAQENINVWTKKLKQKYEMQLTVNEAMETEVPLMVSEAIAEEEKQRSHLFV